MRTHSHIGCRHLTPSRSIVLAHCVTLLRAPDGSHAHSHDGSLCRHKLQDKRLTELEQQNAQLLRRLEQAEEALEKEKQQVACHREDCVIPQCNAVQLWYLSVV